MHTVVSIIESKRGRPASTLWRPTPQDNPPACLRSYPDMRIPATHPSAHTDLVPARALRHRTVQIPQGTCCTLRPQKTACNIHRHGVKQTCHTHPPRPHPYASALRGAQEEDHNDDQAAHGPSTRQTPYALSTQRQPPSTVCSEIGAPLLHTSAPCLS